MPYKQPKNTPIHNDGASEVVTAVIGAAKLIKMGVVAAKAAKAAKVAKVAATAAKAAKAAKAGKTLTTAAKVSKTAKAGKLAAKSAKLGKAGKTGRAANVLKRSGKAADKAKAIGEKATNKALNAGKKMEGKLMKQVNRQMGKSLEPSKLNNAVSKTKDSVNKGFDKAAELTGQDAGDLKSKAGEIGINKATEIEGNIKTKNNSSLTAEDFTQPLGLTQNETEPLDPRYEAKDQPSSYSNPTGASMKGDMPKGYKSSVSDNFKTPKTNYQRFFQNLANNSVNANIGGVKVNVGHVGLIAGHLIGKGVDAVKTKKRLNGIKKQNKIKNESAARAKEEVANKKIMQDIDNRENNIANKTFNKK